MEFDPKQFDDEQLDSLLRDVSIPSDLKHSLRQIPQMQKALDDTIDKKSEQKTNSSSNGRSLRWMIVLAASLVAVAAFAAWQWFPSSNANNSTNIAANTGQSKPNNLDDTGSNPRKGDETELSSLAELDLQISALNSMLAQIEIEKMEQQLLETKNQYEYKLAAGEAQSIITALSSQISLPLGGNEDSVKAEMAQVMEKFPGSMGAEIAREYLQQIQN